MRADTLSGHPGLFVRGQGGGHTPPYRGCPPLSCPPEKTKKSVRGSEKRLAAYQASNREAAAIVLASIDKYGGETALLVCWARLVVANASDKSADESARPLFRREAA